MRGALLTLLMTAAICAVAGLCAAVGTAVPAPPTAGAVPWGASPALLRALSARKTHCVRRHSRRRSHGHLCRTLRPGAQHKTPAGKPAIGVPPTTGPSSGGAPSSGGGAGGAGGASGSEGHPGEAPRSEPPSIPRVQVTAFEYGLTLSRTTVPAGKVIFEFVDGGQDEHNLSAASEEGETAFAFATAQPKEVHDQKVEIKRGDYVLFCTLPEHAAKGMKATLVVQ